MREYLAKWLDGELVVPSYALDDLRKENAALKARVAELEKYKEFHSLVCTITATNFIKANAIREALNKTLAECGDENCYRWDFICNFIDKHADKVERGES